MIGRQLCRRLLWSLAFALLSAFVAAPAAQASSDPFTAPNPGSGSTFIEGNWQFHLGDDPSWSNPSLDDSGWEQISADTVWGAQTHPGYSGFAWYRKQIHVTGRPGRIAVLIPPVEDAYELFWNGQKVGEVGKLPPHAWWWRNGRGVIFPLGMAPLDGVLALRVWQSPNSFFESGISGGLSATPSIGSPQVLTQRTSLNQTRREDVMLPRFILSGALFITGIIALLLFLRERREFLYLWLAAFLIATGLVCIEGLNGVHFGLTDFETTVFKVVVVALQDLSLWLLMLTLFGLQKEKRWRRWTIALTAIYLIAMLTNIFINRFWEYAGRGLQWGDAITNLLLCVLPIYLLFIVVFALWRRPAKALLPIALAATIYGAYN